MARGSPTSRSSARARAEAARDYFRGGAGHAARTSKSLANPYVTSHNATSAACAPGLGVPPRAILRARRGQAYTTRSAKGPLPTLLIASRNRLRLDRQISARDGPAARWSALFSSDDKRV